MTFSLIIILLFLLGEGFFSGSEIAMVSANQLQLKVRAEEGDKGAALALQMLKRPEFLLGTCLIGTNICTVGASTVAAWQFAHIWGAKGTLIVALVLFPVILLYGELVPKSVYRERADTLVTLVVYPLRILSLVLTPILLLLELFTSKLFPALGIQEGNEAPSREDIQRLLEDADEVKIDEDERQIIQRVFAFTEATVEDVMVPLIEVKMIDREASVASAIEAIVSGGHSWLPVYEDRVDHIVGLLHHRDLLEEEDSEVPVHQLMRPVNFVPETKSIDDLFGEFRLSHQRLAIAVDEYGGGVGLVTQEDLLEEIVGEIDDEHDRRDRKVRQLGPRTWLVRARAEEELLLEAIGFKMPEGDYETLAGFMLEHLGHIPQAGERMNQGEWTLEVVRASDRAILEVRMTHTP